MKKEAQKFIENKTQQDSNMLVAIRIRPLDQREIKLGDYDIVRAQDRMLVRLSITVR